MLDPVVLVEVLSPSTARYDRGEKRRRYQGIASLRHYLVVEQHRPLVEHYRRDADGRGWSVEVVEGMAGSVELDEIGGTLGLNRVYERAGEGW